MIEQQIHVMKYDYYFKPVVPSSYRPFRLNSEVRYFRFVSNSKVL